MAKLRADRAKPLDGVVLLSPWEKREPITLQQSSGSIMANEAKKLKTLKGYNERA